MANDPVSVILPTPVTVQEYGDQRRTDCAVMALKEYFLNSIEELKKLSPEERREKKYQKIMNLGSFSE